MGNSASRSSCLCHEDKGQRSEEDYLKECYVKGDPVSDCGNATERNNSEPKKGLAEKSQNPSVFEKGWSSSPGSVKSLQNGVALPKRNNLEYKPQNAKLNLSANRGRPDTPTSLWSLPQGTLQRNSGGSWSWKPLATREVTEVTEVTETIVTEIVEVTQFPSGEKGGEPVVTRTVKVLTECAGELAEVNSSSLFKLKGGQRLEPPHCRGADVMNPIIPLVARRAATLQDELHNANKINHTLESLLNWVSDIEELTANQKPPSSEAKVVKAQLQEQKLLKRLLEDRRLSVELVLQEKQQVAELSPVSEPPAEVDQKATDLQKRWEGLLKNAENRREALERIVPAAQSFQDAMDTVQEWLSSTERLLADHRMAQTGVEQIQEALQKIKAVYEEKKSQSSQLEEAVKSGQNLLKLFTDEEATLVQEKMDSLRMRYLIVSQSSSELLQRLEQTLEVSSRLSPRQEDLNLWLRRMESALASQGEQSITTADRQRFKQAVESETSRSSELEERAEALSRVHLDDEAISSQLRDLKILSVETLQHKDTTERLLGVFEILLSSCSEEEQSTVKSQLKTLEDRCQTVYGRCSNSVLQLEHAQSLLSQVSETYGELRPWLEETQSLIGRLSPPSISHEALKEQQELLQQLRESIAEHKPLIGKLKSVSTRLMELSPGEGQDISAKCMSAEGQYNVIKEMVKEAAGVLEEAIPRYSQLTERMDLMFEQLEQLQDRFQNPSPIRGESARIREQIQDNRVTQGQLEKLGVALNTIRTQGAELIANTQAAGSDPPAKGIQDKVDSLTQQWKNLSDQSEERERWLTKLLALADRFWQDLADLSATLYDTQQIVMEGEPPAADTDSIRQTLSTMQNLREEIDSLQCDLDTLGILGMELMSACGDTDKPDVTKSMDELYCTWNNISKVWTERCTKLEETLESAVFHQDTMQRMLGWLDSAETRISDEFLVGVDLETVKQQLSDLKDFKRELYQQKVEVESLNHRTLSSLHKLCGETQREEIQGPLATFRERWDRLEGEIVNRQHQLESALLGLGQFQHTLDELFSWLAHTAKVLEAQRPISIDLQTCEIELAKHKVLQNDVTSHVRTVESVTQAGQDLLESSPGDNAESLESKLAELSERWEVVRSETMRRQLELENNLSQVQDVTMEMQDLLQWLEHVDLRLSSSKPVWGLPETAKEKLSIHLELCKEMDSKLYAYNDVRDTMHRLLANKDVPRGSNTEHSLNILEQKWECVHGKVQDRKAKLSEGVTIGTEFQSCAQELLRWMTQTEENLSALPPPSLLLDTASEQIQRHRLWLAEVNSYSEKLSAMEAMAIRLKDFSRKQDCTVIQNLLLTVRDRWATVSQHITERGRALEEAKKRAKQEFQKMVRSKRPMYEATLKSGRSLREKAQLPEDHQPLEDQLGELRDKWDTVCAKAMERQHKLEEALLFSGKFTDTLQALMDWLYRAEPQLSEEMPVGGDRDLVTNLIEKHKVFQKELGKRTGCIKTLKRSARDLARGTSADSQWLQEQMEELEARWETVCRLSVSKQARLEAALRQAEEFHSLVQSFLERLSEGGSGGVPETASGVYENSGLPADGARVHHLAGRGDPLLLPPGLCHRYQVLGQHHEDSLPGSDDMGRTAGRARAVSAAHAGGGKGRRGPLDGLDGGG
nr:PREDICTED: microtubule-actin cross-linking factor 1, isoforms 1/2/3/5 [Latimeria chalumnae]|eukprot:XP_014346976.1 PREDICTED: microtubule-actin cross-linking factor 1, isoforms 1/2/3/5 [Latimeria chalumnae]